jgi:NADPH:quinone reductase-like Zn-dependent oxidoreductase
MKAAVFTAPFELSITDLETPQPAPGEVLVRVAATGLCAGDFYIYLGNAMFVESVLTNMGRCKIGLSGAQLRRVIFNQ